MSLRKIVPSHTERSDFYKSGHHVFSGIFNNLRMEIEISFLVRRWSPFQKQKQLKKGGIERQCDIVQQKEESENE